MITNQLPSCNLTGCFQIQDIQNEERVVRFHNIQDPIKAGFCLSRKVHRNHPTHTLVYYSLQACAMSSDPTVVVFSEAIELLFTGIEKKCEVFIITVRTGFLIKEGISGEGSGSKTCHEHPSHPLSQGNRGGSHYLDSSRRYSVFHAYKLSFSTIARNAISA